jgi:hypothetical protein
MAKSHKVAQLYGYAVCLAAVITFLISIAALVGAVFDLSDPLHAGGGWMGGDFLEPKLASFETYKMSVLNPVWKTEDSQKVQYVPDDETLHKMYDAARANKIQSTRLQAHKQIAVKGILIVTCIALFATHWIWVRRFTKMEAAAV